MGRDALTTHIDSMHDETIEALRRLAVVLMKHPEDVQELQLYGELADHLSDILNDLDL